MGWAWASFRIDWAVWPSVAYRNAVESQSNHNHNYYTRHGTIQFRQRPNASIHENFAWANPEPRTLVRDTLSSARLRFGVDFTVGCFPLQKGGVPAQGIEGVV